MMDSLYDYLGVLIIMGHMPPEQSREEKDAGYKE